MLRGAVVAVGVVDEVIEIRGIVSLRDELEQSVRVGGGEEGFDGRGGWGWLGVERWFSALCRRLWG